MHNLTFFLNSGQKCPLVYNCRSWTSGKILRVILKLIVCPLSLPGYFRYRNIQGRKGLALVVIVKDEAPYIEEWIKFHARQGVTHFIVYDNGSTDNLHEVLKPCTESGLVTYQVMKGKARQLDAYNKAIHDYGRKFKYMGFIDADEFVFTRKNVSLYDFVDEFMHSHPNAGGIGINWCVFGSNGHLTKPEGGVLENYTTRLPDASDWNSLIKTICDPLKVFYYGHVHFPAFRKGFHNLTENGEIITGSKSPVVSFCNIRCNHYVYKSKEEYLAKRMRGQADSTELKSVEGFMKVYDAEQELFTVTDTEILSRV